MKIKEMRESKLLRVYYLHVFSSGLRKWLKFEIHELEYKRTMLSSSKRIFRLNFSSEQNSKENCLLEFDSIAKLIGCVCLYFHNFFLLFKFLKKINLI
jgi:hypothetical protein